MDFELLFVIIEIMFLSNKIVLFELELVFVVIEIMFVSKKIVFFEQLMSKVENQEGVVDFDDITTCVRHYRNYVFK